MASLVPAHYIKILQSILFLPRVEVSFLREAEASFVLLRSILTAWIHIKLPSDRTKCAFLMDRTFGPHTITNLALQRTAIQSSA